MRGKLVVFEGIDGSGKTTQVNLLLKYFKSKKIAASASSFPRYSKPWGKMVRRYLDGEFGKVGEVNPYLASVLYAGDRQAAKDEIERDLSRGKIVVADRYTASNIAHQSVKLNPPAGGPSDKSKFTNWVEDFEYNQNKIPREDLVILLSVPVNFSQNLMKDKKRDIHEKDVKYLAQVATVFEQLSGQKKNWVRVNSVKSEKLLPPEKIHKTVLEILRNHNIY